MFPDPLTVVLVGEDKHCIYLFDCPLFKEHMILLNVLNEFCEAPDLIHYNTTVLEAPDEGLVTTLTILVSRL